jgi:deoxycytidine triphosphate deaminase
MENNKDEKTDGSVPPGMLSSPHIAYCAKKYRIISDYDPSCLDSASYQMRVGGSVLTWDRGTKIAFELGDNEDKNRNIRKSVDLKPNSLTFLTTIEEFRLTKDIIARFNLKSKWVHQGLLLGTGPIVDPQLHARLLIPVHNFSSQTVTMNYGQKFISVEFTKTLDPDSVLVINESEKTEFIPNPNWNYDFHRYRERIENKKVESSVQNQFEESKEQIESSRTAIQQFKESADEKINTLSRFNIITIVGVIISIFILILSTWNLIRSTNTKADAAYDLSKSTSDEMKVTLRKYQEEMKTMELTIKELDGRTKSLQVQVNKK